MLTKETSACHKGGKICVAVLLVANIILSSFAFYYSYQNYSVEVIRGGGKENFETMNEFYQTQAFVDYVTSAQADSISSFQGAQGSLGNDTIDTSGTPTANANGTSVASIATNLGLDEDAFTSCYASSEADDAVDATTKEGSSVFGISGTPGNVVLNKSNGEYVVIEGAYPATEFEDAVTAVSNGDYSSLSSDHRKGSLEKTKIAEILADAHFYGNADANIVIFEYSDLLCPFCKRHYNDQTIETVVANHSDQVALVFKNFPLPSLHPTAPIGAKGLYCAGEIGGSEVYYDYLSEAIKANTFTN
jgi:protein-disulfide isomerase